MVSKTVIFAAVAALTSGVVATSTEGAIPAGAVDARELNVDLQGSVVADVETPARLERRGRKHHKKGRKGHKGSKGHSSSSSSSSSSGMEKADLPGGFSGTNTGIGSWFRSNYGGDSTNGKSWCGISYEDSDPLFAPKFGTMSPSHATWGTDPQKWRAAGEKYCGLEAEVTYNGKTVLMYVGDAFDDDWVLSPGSIDILTGPWADLYGKQASDKSTVMQDVKWKFTGKRNPKYKFQG